MLLPPEKEGSRRGEDRGDLNEPRKPETVEDDDRREQEQRHPGREAHTAGPFTELVGHQQSGSEIEGDARAAGEGKQREQQAHQCRVDLERTSDPRGNARDHAVGAVSGGDGADVDHGATASLVPR